MIIYEKSNLLVDTIGNVVHIEDIYSMDLVGIPVEEFEEIIKAYQKWKNENPSTLNAPSTEG